MPRLVTLSRPSIEVSPVASTRIPKVIEEKHTTTTAGQPIDDVVEDERFREANQGPRLQDQTSLLPMKQLLVVFSGLSVAMFCSMLNQTIVITALPVLGAVFHQADIAAWVSTAYLLTSTACQPLYGRLTDVFGRKMCLSTSLGIFLVGSILSGVAQNMIMLIAARAIAGIGGGGIVTIVSIVVSDVVSLKNRGKYQSIIGVVVAVANATGPVAGGIFTEKISWRWCFYISIPFSGLAMVIVTIALPLKKVEGDMMSKTKKIDGWGCLASFLASIAILLSISWAGSRYPWDSAAVLAPLVIGIVLFGVFLFIELKVAKLPLIPLHVFKNLHVSVCICTSFLTGFMTFVNLYYLPQFYQVARGDSPLKAGLLILPLISSQIVTSFSSGFLVSKYGCYRINMVIGYALWTIACGLLTTVTASTPNKSLIGYQLLSGFGSGQTLQTGLIAIQAAVKREEMAVITGARNYLRMMGSTLAIAISAAIINNTVRPKLEALNFPTSAITSILSDPTKVTSLALSAIEKSQALDAYAHGIKIIYIMMTVLAGLQFILCVIFVKDYSLRREDDDKRKAEAKAWVKAQKKGKKQTKAKANVGAVVAATIERQDCSDVTTGEKIVMRERDMEKITRAKWEAGEKA